MKLRVLDQEDAFTYRELHLEALADAPESFGGNLEEERDMPIAQIALGLRPGPGSFVLGAFADTGQLVGIAGFGRGRPQEPGASGAVVHGMVWGMYVCRACRRQGVARALLMRVIELAKTLDGLHTLRLRVVADNAPARTLYESTGFRLTGVERAAFELDGRAHDEAWMELALR